MVVGGLGWGGRWMTLNMKQGNLYCQGGVVVGGVVGWTVMTLTMQQGNLYCQGGAEGGRCMTSDV